MTFPRRKTREVLIGKVGVGGGNPVRIQSMCNSDTYDVEATVEQVIRLRDTGCEIVRVTVQGKREAKACREIKNCLIQRGIDTPLVADIHFYPPAAMEVVDYVDKVRINPGNFADRRARFKIIEYDEESYQSELERIEEVFTPLVLRCKKLGKPLRIGTNHGSLSDRILNRYGDTPAGMVESALEYARIARKQDFHELIFSMKSSNVRVMIHAYRLLAARMEELGWDYPFHLGVTEAGAGEEGRIKSATGIGSLLCDGLGDTIRISLTEDPWEEIDPCRRLLELYRVESSPPKELDYRKREVHLPSSPALHRDGTVWLRSREGTCDPAPDGYLEEITQKNSSLPLAGELSLLRVFAKDPESWKKIEKNSADLLLLTLEEEKISHARKFFTWLERPLPVILHARYEGEWQDTLLRAGIELGSLLCDGLGEGICLEGPYSNQQLATLSYSILQAARMRAVKTEFISCPGCGRTLFDLQEVAADIRKHTDHLPGVKIAIMGCIVNGPGEMADADFGYVGSRPGKIDLYVGKECVEKNIDMASAKERLIALIKEHNQWIEPLRT